MRPTRRRRATRFLVALVASSALPGAAHAQVTESERAAARQLFHEGDELQRAGKFVEALDKFQRAQQVFSAPTNVLRIAECDAALGHLVASAEAYRALVRTPLPPGSPAAFQAAVDQARGELAQVEPRVPRLVIELDPAGAPGPALEIDGQAVPAALLGEPFPLDPGAHDVRVSASGFVSAHQSVVLKERETRSLPVVLRPIAGVTYAPGPAPAAPSPAPARREASTTLPPSTELPPGTPPPPPPIADEASSPVRPRSRVALLFGAHLGLEVPAGQIPTPAGQDVDASSLSGGGFAYALDGGVCVARHWILGLTLEHAGLGAGKTPADLAPAARALSSNTTALGAVLGFVVNPDRASFFGEVGVQYRWYTLSWNEPAGPQSANYGGGELLLGVGLWLPAGRTVRFLPEVTAGLGAFGPPDTGAGNAGSGAGTAGHGFVMLGLAGLFNVDL
jgi:hypothetical protein